MKTASIFKTTLIATSAALVFSSTSFAQDKNHDGLKVLQDAARAVNAPTEVTPDTENPDEVDVKSPDAKEKLNNFSTVGTANKSAPVTGFTPVAGAALGAKHESVEAGNGLSSASATGSQRTGLGAIIAVGAVNDEGEAPDDVDGAGNGEEDLDELYWAIDLGVKGELSNCVTESGAVDANCDGVPDKQVEERRPISERLRHKARN